MKFGKLAPRHGKLKLAKYIDRSVLPAPPERLAWSAKATKPWGMMLNDNIGDCTCACAGHLIQTWTANASAETTLPDRDILKAYEAVSGYNPIEPWTDNGAVILDVLNYWRKHGIGGHKIGAYAEIDLGDPRIVEDAIELFIGVDIGFNVPQSAMDQINAGKIWTDEGDTNIVGGHSVAVVDYDPEGLTCVTWGQLQKMTWAFWQKYCDEAWAIISQDFLKAGVAPNGFNLSQLTTDLAAVTA